VALETLHNKNVIHRDVKPGNIFFRADGHIVLGDFGFSEIFDFAQGKWGQGALVRNVSWMSFDVDNDSDSGSFLKPDRDEKPAYSTNKVCGTPYYMSPEQHYGEDYSFGVDFWGMGVTLYRMLTNRVSGSS
jgi:serine/threonine protein kinase